MKSILFSILVLLILQGCGQHDTPILIAIEKVNYWGSQTTRPSSFYSDKAYVNGYVYEFFYGGSDHYILRKTNPDGQVAKETKIWNGKGPGEIATFYDTILVPFDENIGLFDNTTNFFHIFSSNLEYLDTTLINTGGTATRISFADNELCIQLMRDGYKLAFFNKRGEEQNALSLGTIQDSSALGIFHYDSQKGHILFGGSSFPYRIDIFNTRLDLITTVIHKKLKDYSPLKLVTYSTTVGNSGQGIASTSLYEGYYAISNIAQYENYYLLPFGKVNQPKHIGKLKFEYPPVDHDNVLYLLNRETLQFDYKVSSKDMPTNNEGYEIIGVDDRFIVMAAKYHKESSTFREAYPFPEGETPQTVIIVFKNTLPKT